MRTQLEGAQRRHKTLQGESNHRHKLKWARQRQREESGISPRSVGGRGGSSAASTSDASSSTGFVSDGGGSRSDSGDASLEEEARRLRRSNAELERKLARHEERRFALARLANDQSFARKRLAELQGELRLLTEALSLRTGEVTDAREVMAPSGLREEHARRMEAMASEVKRWRAKQGEAERESTRLHTQLARTKNALAPFFAAREMLGSARPPADATAAQTMGEALAGHAVRAAADAQRSAELARKRNRRTAILDAAVAEAVARISELRSHHRAEGTAPSEPATPRALGVGTQAGGSWLPLDTRLSRDEMQNWLLTVMESDPARASDIFDAADEESDGKLDRNAFLSAMLLLGMSPFGVGQPARDELFDFLDRHGKGRVAHAELLWLLKGGALQSCELLSPRELQEQGEQQRDNESVVLAQAVVRRKLTQRSMEGATQGTVRLQALMRGRLAKRNLALLRAVEAARLGGEVCTLTETSNSFEQVASAGDHTQEQTTVRRADAPDEFGGSHPPKTSRVSKIELKEETGDEGHALKADPPKLKSGMCTML
jgi:Ca2+-binding EF-hand superfamily protein